MEDWRWVLPVSNQAKPPELCTRIRGDNYKCHGCSREFKAKLYLDLHIRKACDSQKYYHKCGHCSLIFYHRADLDFHRREHSPRLTRSRFVVDESREPDPFIPKYTNPVPPIEPSPPVNRTPLTQLIQLTPSSQPIPLVQLIPITWHEYNPLMFQL